VGVAEGLAVGVGVMTVTSGIGMAFRGRKYRGRAIRAVMPIRLRATFARNMRLILVRLSVLVDCGEF